MHKNNFQTAKRIRFNVARSQGYVKVYTECVMFKDVSDTIYVSRYIRAEHYSSYLRSNWGEGE